METIQKPARILIIALLFSLLYQILTWKNISGLAFWGVSTALAVSGALALLFEKKKVAPAGMALILWIVVFSAVPFFRLEPFTVAAAVLLTLFGLCALALTARGGSWIHFGWLDWLVGGFKLVIAGLSGGFVLLGSIGSTSTESSESTPGRKRILGPVLVGLLLGLPVMLVFGVLLSEADPIFGDLLKRAFSWLTIERLPEYIWRTIYLVFVAFIAAGVLRYSLLHSAEPRLAGGEKPLQMTFLGIIQSGIVLGGVILMFALFVGVQFRYFFGGQANIERGGYTYSDYAVRGFTELVVVAVLSLLLFYLLSVVTRRENGRERVWFSALGTILIALVGVMLVSAYQRLLMYEMAYGFSRLRTVSHIFMIFLGVLLAVVLALEWTGRMQKFTLAVILTAAGLGAALAVMNVDSFILHQNLARTTRGEELDGSYLTQLSDDLLPAAVQAFENTAPGAVRDQLGALLSCRALSAEWQPLTDWRQFHAGQARARESLNKVLPELKTYQLLWKEDSYQWQGTFGGQELFCPKYSNGEWMD